MLVAMSLSAVLFTGGVATTVWATFAGRPPSPAHAIGVLDPPTRLAGPTVPSAPTVPAGLARSVPVALDIPAVGIHTPLIQLGLNPDGTLAVPPLTRAAPAGWYRFLASPGEVGTAVVVGHVDSARDGPAVFFRLGLLRPGDTVTVRRADGRDVRFVVDAVRRYAKDGFPADEVYRSATYPALRLITCGGRFDRRHHHYRDVVVIYAAAQM